MRYSGRPFTVEEIEWIRQLIGEEPRKNRAQLSRVVCQHLECVNALGHPKEMSCRVAMLRMQDDGLIRLPAPLKGNGNGRAYTRITAATNPGRTIDRPVHELRGFRLEVVTDQKQSHLWNQYIKRYHYLGFKPLPGAQIRYFVFAQAQPLAALGFGASAWKIAPRDAWIGWNEQQRQERLQLIVNNARFLIFPWIKSKNLASKILAETAKRIPKDWQERYGYQPVLLETFVEKHRFQATCYRAANWIHVGETKGRGKLDTKHQARKPVKNIYIFPLRRDCRKILVG